MSETTLHFAVVDLLRKLHKPGVWFWHCANGELRNKATAGKLRKMGVTPGVADIIVSLPDARMAFMELKWSDNRLTGEQKDFLEAMAERGHETAVCYTLDAALEVLTQWGALRCAAGSYRSIVTAQTGRV